MHKQIISLFWRISNRYAITRFLAISFPVLAVVANGIIAPYILSQFLNRLQAGEVTLENSASLIITYALLIFVGEVVLWRLALYFCWTFEVNSQRDLYLKIFNKLAREDMNFHANRFGGSLVSQSSKLLGAFERFWDMIVWSVVPMLTTVIGSIVAMLILGLWQYATFLVIYAVGFCFITIIASRFLAQRNREEASASNKTSGYIADMVTNIATVKAFGREHYEEVQAGGHINTWHQKSNRLKWGVIGATSAFSTMLAIGTIGALVFAVFTAESGAVMVGTIYLVFIYAVNVNRQLWEMNNITRTYNRVIGDADEMTQILHKEYDLIDNTTKRLVAKSGEIVFQNVSFTHDHGAGEQVFQNFNLTIPAGQRVGLVGYSGSGKTTLTRILLRFSDIDAGRITIGGQDISQVTQESLHESIAYVPQDPLLFHRGLGENIAYGKQSATVSEIKQAAKNSHAVEFIDKLPEGLDTVVGERGIKLSGGQRQRIAIARALLKDAPILVLDEATSALDSTSEKLIQASLSRLMHGRTSIVIAHRLSTIAKLDRIIVLEDGEIVEDGSHAELLEKGGAYSKLWAHQSGGFIDE